MTGADFIKRVRKLGRSLLNNMLKQLGLSPKDI